MALVTYVLACDGYMETRHSTCRLRIWHMSSGLVDKVALGLEHVHPSLFGKIYK
jgi:hypothetical protein